MTRNWRLCSTWCLLCAMLAALSGRAQEPDRGAANSPTATAAAAQGSDSAGKTEQTSKEQVPASEPTVPNPFKPAGSLAPSANGGNATGENAGGSETGSAGNSKSKLPVTRRAYYVYPRNYAKTSRRYYRPPLYNYGGFPRGYRVPSGWVDPNMGNGGLNYGNGWLNYGNSWLNYGNSY